MSPVDVERITRSIADVPVIRKTGRVTHVVGLVIEALGPAASVGEICHVTNESGETIAAEVVGFKEKKVLLMPLGPMHGVNPGSIVHATGRSFRVPVGPSLLGRVIDGLGRTD